MTDPDTTLYRQEVRIAAPPDTVFEYFADADTMRRWIGIATTVDATIGGELMIDMNGQDIVRGEFVVVDRPQRVVFSWGYQNSADMPPGSSTVEVTLEPDGQGTLLTLTHSDCPTDRLDDHAGGWRHFLGRLIKEASANSDPSANQHKDQT